MGDLDIFSFDNFLHACGGGLMTVAAKLLAMFAGIGCAWVGVPVALAVGVYREYSQHGTLNLSGHQWTEALSWGVGAALVAAALNYI